MAGLVPAGFGAPGDCKARGVVVMPPGEADGTSPGPAVPLFPLSPLRPEEPPWPGPGFLLLPGTLFVDPPAGPPDGDGCGPAATPATMAPAASTAAAAPATMARG